MASHRISPATSRLSSRCAYIMYLCACVCHACVASRGKHQHSPSVFFFFFFFFLLCIHTRIGLTPLTTIASSGGERRPVSLAPAPCSFVRSYVRRSRTPGRKERRSGRRKGPAAETSDLALPQVPDIHTRYLDTCIHWIHKKTPTRLAAAREFPRRYIYPSLPTAMRIARLALDASPSPRSG